MLLAASLNELIGMGRPKGSHHPLLAGCPAQNSRIHFVPTSETSDQDRLDSQMENSTRERNHEPDPNPEGRQPLRRIRLVRAVRRHDPQEGQRAQARAHIGRSHAWSREQLLELR